MSTVSCKPSPSNDSSVVDFPSDDDPTVATIRIVRADVAPRCLPRVARRKTNESRFYVFLWKARRRKRGPTAAVACAQERSSTGTDGHRRPRVVTGSTIAPARKLASRSPRSPCPLVKKIPLNNPHKENKLRKRKPPHQISPRSRVRVFFSLLVVILLRSNKKEDTLW